MIAWEPLQLRPDPGAARDWLRSELARPEYQQSPLQRAVHWFWGLFGKLIDSAQKVGLLSPAVALVLLALVVTGLAVVLARLRREPRSRDTGRAVLGDTRIPAAQYRARAQKALAEERWDDAVVEGLRAIAVGLVERALTEDLPSATAHEVAEAAAEVFPAERGRLQTAARLFDDVRYGDRHATRAGAGDLLDLERTLRELRPASRSVDGPVLAVPR